MATDKTPADYEAKILELEQDYEDVINMSAEEIATHEYSGYWRSKQSRFLMGLDMCNWALDRKTDNDKYLCLRNWREVYTKHGLMPPGTEA